MEAGKDPTFMLVRTNLIERIEGGLLSYENDMNCDTPHEAGLGRSHPKLQIGCVDDAVACGHEGPVKQMPLI
jgi:dimethylsulfoniopropionate demethylase